MDAFPPNRSLQSYDDKEEAAKEDDSSSDEEVDEDLREAINQVMIDRRRLEARWRQKEPIGGPFFDFKRKLKDIKLADIPYIGGSHCRWKKTFKISIPASPPLDTDSTHLVEQAPLQNITNDNKSFESWLPVTGSPFEKARQETSALNADR